MQRRDPLFLAAAGFLAANLLHTADHLRQGVGGLSAAILVAGSGLTLGAVYVLVLAARGHEWTAPIATTLGLSGAVGIAAAHLAPHWSALSDSYPEIGADALSWTVVLMEIGGALVLAYAGARELRGERATVTA
jgi:hypothetical protein